MKYFQYNKFIYLIILFCYNKKMKQLIRILYIFSNTLFFITIILVIVNGFIKNNTLILIIGILVLVAFTIAFIHFIFSLIVKRKLTLYEIFHLLLLLSYSILTISGILDVRVLQYRALVIMIPTIIIGFYLEHEDDIKSKVEKQKGRKDNNSN